MGFQSTVHLLHLMSQGHAPSLDRLRPSSKRTSSQPNLPEGMEVSIQSKPSKGGKSDISVKIKFPRPAVPKDEVGEALPTVFIQFVLVLILGWWLFGPELLSDRFRVQSLSKEKTSCVVNNLPKLDEAGPKAPVTLKRITSEITVAKVTTAG